MPGSYEVFVHNGNGGKLGWREAGELEVIATANRIEKFFNVRDCGARGGDEENDYVALTEALAAAKSAASNASLHAVVYFLRAWEVPKGHDLASSSPASPCAEPAVT